MTVLAMRVGAVRTHDIRCVTHRFEMFRIHASLHSAQMVDHKAIRNRALEKFIGNSMRSIGFAITDSYASVSAAQCAALPQPTAWRDEDFLFPALDERSGFQALLPMNRPVFMSSFPVQIPRLGT